jgi:hypothetical protein
LTGSCRSREQGYVSQARKVLRRVEKVLRGRKTRFIQSYPDICPPFFVDC